MSWIKRNLYFLIGSIVSVALLGAASWYLWSKMQLNNHKLEELNSAYGELEQLSSKKPNPGNDKVDNIELAAAQGKQISVQIEKVRKYFVSIPPIPDSTNVTDQDFATAMRSTADRLQRDAARGSVALPTPRYFFSFEAERQLVKFSSTNLQELAVQLGEVKTICDILFNAKINSFDGLRRERVSEDDLKGPQSDYLDEHSTTNDLAVVTPYEVTFHCFSPELGNVLAGLANNANGVTVKALNVDSSTMGSAVTRPNEAMPMVGYPPNMPNSPMPGTSVSGTAIPAIKRGGLPIVLDEKQIKVTMMMNVIKLLPPKP
jgi:hypothetical protein